MNTAPRFLIPVVVGIAVVVMLVISQKKSPEDDASANVDKQASSSASKEAETVELAAKEKAETEAAEVAAKAKAEAAEIAAKAKAEAEAAEIATKAKAEAEAAEIAAKAKAEAEAEAAEIAAKAKAEAEAEAAEIAAKAKAEAAELAAKAETAKLAEKAKAEAADLAAKANLAKAAATTAIASVSSNGNSSAPQYGVKDGMVDKGTFNGYRRFHGTCHACHGQDAAGGSFAPSLVESLKTIDYAEFTKVVTDGRQATSSTGAVSAMPAFSNDPNIMKHLDDIYRYLAARSDGVVGTGRPMKIPK
ncbi:MAG: cytochrome c [Granulosicoccus sp.]